MEQPDCSFDLYNHHSNWRGSYQELMFFQSLLFKDNYDFGNELAADKVQVANEFKEYYDKNDYENLNVLNWDNQYWENDVLFNNNWDIDFKRISEQFKLEKYELFDVPIDKNQVYCYSKLQDDKISIKSQHSEKEDFVDDKIIEATKLERSSMTTRKGSETEDIKWDKVVDDSYSNETIDYSQKLDEGSLIFLIRKFDRKTNKSVLLTKHRKKITKCPHNGLEYYAKGMCKNCYHNKGTKSKKAFKCIHHERDHYAKGLCKNCYLHFFHIKKKQRKESLNLYSSIQE